MTTQDLLLGYQQLLTLSDTMLTLARQGLWDELVTHETAYVRSVESVACANSTSALPAALRREIHPVLQQILHHETEIKALLMQRMDELRILVQTTSQQQKVHSAYGQLSNQVLYPTSL